jgi:hypothetical protein
VTDGSGNTARATQVVTVTDNVDPIITSPVSVRVNTNSGCTATGVSLGTPKTSDNCSVASVTNDAPARFPLGNTTVTWTVTDGSGNTATAMQVVTVTDVTAPVITLIGSGATPDRLWSPDHTMREIAITYTSSDNCSSNCKITSITSSEPANDLGDGSTATDWEYVDNQHVRLRAERSGKGDGRTYTITITCTDASGNSSSKNVLVTVPKSQSGNNSQQIITSSRSGNKAKDENLSVAANMKIVIYPNPASSRVMIQLSNSNASRGEVALINSNGALVQKKLLQMNGSGQTIFFNVTNYPSGIYLVRVVTDQGIQTSKVVIQQ